MPRIQGVSCNDKHYNNFNFPCLCTQNKYILVYVTLSALSDKIRKIYKWGLLALVLIFFLWVGWFIISSLSNLIFKPVGDDIAYGKLAPPIFTRTFQRVKSENFILEAKLPKTAKNPKAQVFKIENPVGINEDEQEKLTRGLGLVGEEKTSTNRGESSSRAMASLHVLLQILPVVCKRPY